MTVVMIVGKFDPPHDGHIDHILKAAALGDRLIVVAHPDEILDKIKPKGHAVPLWARLVLLRGIIAYYGLIADVVTDYWDEDGTAVKAVGELKPDILAKGGDRTADNMPPEEIKACQAVGCHVVYGVGGLLNSSTKINRDATS